LVAISLEFFKSLAKRYKPRPFSLKRDDVKTLIIITRLSGSDLVDKIIKVKHPNCIKLCITKMMIYSAGQSSTSKYKNNDKTSRYETVSFKTFKVKRKIHPRV